MTYTSCHHVAEITRHLTRHGLLSKKVYTGKKKSLSSLLAHNPNYRETLVISHFSLDDATSPVYTQELKMTSTRTYCGNDAKDE